jgi:hypothetical protein
MPRTVARGNSVGLAGGWFAGDAAVSERRALPAQSPLKSCVPSASAHRLTLTRMGRCRTATEEGTDKDFSQTVA